jgi:hypothetical protein
LAIFTPQNIYDNAGGSYEVSTRSSPTAAASPHPSGVPLSHTVVPVAESSAAMSAEKKEPELTLPERRLCLAHCLMKLM